MITKVIFILPIMTTLVKTILTTKAPENSAMNVRCFQRAFVGKS